MARLSITHLSVVQTLGLAVTAAGGSVVWLVATALAHPADLGTLGRVVSTSTLVASLVTAGLGQFLLAIARSASRAQLQRYFWMSMAAGCGPVALFAMMVELAQSQAFTHTALAMGLLGAGVAATNLQDAIYLGTGQAHDVPLKSAAVLLIRLALLLLCAAFAINLPILLAIFVVSQLAVGAGWAALRAPKAIQNHAPGAADLKKTGDIRHTLGVSYLYALAVAAIVSGVPAFVTSLIPAESAGAFYIAWTMAGLLASLPIAMANSVIAVSLAGAQRVRRLAWLLAGLLAAQAAGSVLIIHAVPILLVLLNQYYAALGSLLTTLAAGQICFGITVVALAVYRTLAQGRRLVAVLTLWPLVVVGSVLGGLAANGISGGAIGFVAGNALTAMPMCALAFGAARMQSHPTTAIAAKVAG